MSYNLTGIAAANTTLDIFKEVNTDLTGGMLGNFMVLALGILLFLSMSYYSAKDALLFTGLILGILSMILSLLGIVQFFVVIICFSISLVAVILHNTT